jgi:hypothetical protein
MKEFFSSIGLWLIRVQISRRCGQQRFPIGERACKGRIPPSSGVILIMQPHVERIPCYFGFRGKRGRERKRDRGRNDTASGTDAARLCVRAKLHIIIRCRHRAGYFPARRTHRGQDYYEQCLIIDEMKARGRGGPIGGAFRVKILHHRRSCLLARYIGAL